MLSRVRPHFSNAVWIHPGLVGGGTFLSHHENLKLSHTNKICDVKQILSSIFLLFLELAS